MATEQTVERRQLGATLQTYRTSRGRTQAEVAKLLNKGDISKVSKIEKGTATLQADELARILDYLDVPEVDRDPIMKVGERARKKSFKSRHKSYTDTLPASFQRRAYLEAAATEIYSFESGIVPGLLQSQAYMRAIMQSGYGIFWDDDSLVEDRIEFRLERQKVVLQPSKRLSIAFTRDALDIRNVNTKRDQLRHLLKLHDQYPNLTISLVEPNDLERIPVLSGGITVMNFGRGISDLGFSHAAYGPTVYIDDSEEVGVLRKIVQRIQDVALDPISSINIIRKELLKANEENPADLA
ncbi:transcriptional regulator with XRE-family HTH domain [Crossiella equi]|uniref:Transcriptional regulator with XRE-family HTH domain n=1 Tax=Crossiella equi TaxID=130796 RepID=A0ABS5AJ75_9PSEU|nr:helix-turn-helix transcriptional regulator [Crossiella equi]MBP2476621.1 transcriptional regulator with XRE-family HTH domain [Crossiella equi]